jgi:hypothetical protein
LLAIQESLIGFLLDQVVNLTGKHYYDGLKNYCDAPPLGVETRNLSERYFDVYILFNSMYNIVCKYILIYKCIYVDM